MVQKVISRLLISSVRSRIFVRNRFADGDFFYSLSLSPTLYHFGFSLHLRTSIFARLEIFRFGFWLLWTATKSICAAQNFCMACCLFVVRVFAAVNSFEASSFDAVFCAARFLFGSMPNHIQLIFWLLCLVGKIYFSEEKTRTILKTLHYGYIVDIYPWHLLIHILSSI